MKNYKMLIVLVTIILVAVGVTILVVYLNSIEKGTNFKLGDYTVVSQGAGVAIVTYDGDETTLEVPAKIEGKKIVAVKEDAFKDSKVVSLSFAAGANIDIEENAFNGNTTIQEVTLPANMTSIPKNCFMNCSSLTKVDMPDTITFIGEYAFYGCTNLTKNFDADEAGYRWLDLPKSLKEICNSAFYECTALDCVRVSDALELIDNNAFRNSGLQKIALYEEDASFAIKEIGNYAFYGSYILSNDSNLFEMPKLTKIGSYAFASTSNNFKSFTIPSSVTSIGDYAFSGSSSLLTLVFESNEEGDVEFDELGKYLCASSTKLEEVNFKRSIKTIPEGMFMGCISLLYKQNLQLPEEVAEIGPAAFAFFVTSSSSTKYCNYTITFKHTDANKQVTYVNYNDNFRVSQLQRFNSSSSSNLKHFIVTDYDITELYAYVGLYTTSCTWVLDSKEAESFKFLLAGEYVSEGTPKTFGTISVIHNSAFAGAQFDKLCLPGAACNIEKNAFYKSSIDTIYIDSTCLDHTCSIDESAFDNMTVTTDKLRVLICCGNKSQRSAYNASEIKKQIDAINEDIIDFSTETWPK